MDRKPDDKPNGVSPKPADTAVQHANAPLDIVLQWLSYAFWGSLVGALMWLVVIVLTLAIRGEVFDGATPYALAAVGVLLPIAYVTDLLYRRREPGKKVGMAAVVMVIHAVLFALFAIGTLIGAVFVSVALLLSTESDASSGVIVLLSLFVAALLYALLFVRIITPQRPKNLSFIVSIVLLALSLGLLAWGIAGPAVQTVARKDDRRIERYLPDVQRAVSQYTQSQSKLPESLADVKDTMPRDARALVDDQLVLYRKDDPVPPVQSRTGARIALPQQELRYQLCATYKASSPNADRPDRYSSYSDDDESAADGYRTYISTYGHAKGEVCYKVKVRVATRLEAYQKQE